jgi:DNA processing protein
MSDSGAPDACVPCLRRAWLIASLGAFIQTSCDDLPGRRTPELLALEDEELVAAVAPRRSDRILSENAGLTGEQMRLELAVAGCWSCCRHHDAFPPGLRESPDGPRCLIGCGPAERLAQLEMSGAVTVVGARRATGYGLEIARSLGSELAGAGLAVVSGMALGVDGAVHRGAIERGLTVAVLGCGPDRPYPASHTRLYRRIVEQGLVISEMPPGARPWRWSFPARNRIMAAIARMTVVVEAAKGSGSLITAGMANDGGREVGAVPGPVTSRASAGANDLIVSGAALVRDGADVLDRMFGIGVRALADPKGPPVGADERRLLRAMDEGHRDLDRISAAAGLDLAAAGAGMARLEISGYVSCALTGQFVRTGMTPPDPYSSADE